MELLLAEWLGKPVWMWAGFVALVILLLAFDLGILNRNAREIGVRDSLILSAFYIGLGLAFGGWVWHALGQEAALLYWTGFVVEKSLALDNVFVIATIFAYFAVPRVHQHRVLIWGILGVILLRGIMIGLGTAIVQEFAWVLYVFAAILVVTGIKMLVSGDAEHDVGASPVLKWLRRHLPVTDGLRGERFLVREPDPATGTVRLFATPLLLALILVELADLLFAIDSIPAVFAITTDPFLVYTSNIFAILGLRALYFALAAMMNRFPYLKYALSAVLIFIGSKIFVADMLGLAKIPPMISLGVTLGLLAAGVVASLWATRGQAAAAPPKA